MVLEMILKSAARWEEATCVYWILGVGGERIMGSARMWFEYVWAAGKKSSRSSIGTKLP